MRFVYPWLLLLLPVVPVLGVAWFWLEQQAFRSLGLLVSPALQPRLTPPRSRVRFQIQLALALASLLLVVVAVARPQWGHRTEKEITHSRNLVIALDVSRSMLARDVHPNRLERARVDIMDLISELKGDRAALLVFRRRGTLLCPLTTDYAFLRQALDGVTIDSAPRGETDLGDAITKSLAALEGAPEDANAILLISDGGDLAGAALEAAREAGRRGIPIFTVGIGDTAGATIPQDDGTGAVTYNGQTVQTCLEEKALIDIARESGGRYVPFGTAGTAQTTLGAIFRQHLRQVAAREQQERVEHRYIERYQWFLLPALLLLLLAAALSRGRFANRATPHKIESPAPRTTPPVPPPMATTAALLLLLFAANAQADDPASPIASTNLAAHAEPAAPNIPPGRAGARMAQSLYNRGHYADAADAYIIASRGADAEEAQECLFNAALARDKAGDKKDAAELLAPLTHGRTTGDRAAEKLGLMTFDLAAATNGVDAAEAKIAFVEQAGSAFQTALRNQPDDARRRRNLTRVETQLPVLRDDAHIASVLRQHGKTPPDELVEKMLREQRALIAETPNAFTNEAIERIRRLEALGDRQEQNTDLWIPLKQAVLQSRAMTNEQQRAEFAQGVEITRKNMSDAADKLRDLDPAAASEIVRLEAPVYFFWRTMAAPPPLLDEDIALQSNAIHRVGQPLVPSRPDQPEALDLTKLFQQHFPKWADEMAQAAQSDTNAPTLKPEDRAEIERLAGETITLQQQAVQNAPSNAQHQSLKNLLCIRELLPKQKQQQQQQEKQTQPKQQPQQQKPQPKPPEQKDKQEEKKEQPQEQKEQPPQNVQDMMQRALQREKEHEAKLREQNHNIPMLPNEKDW